MLTDYPDAVAHRPLPPTLASVVRILLVEDHTAVREAVAAMFESQPGFEVVAQAASLREARTRLAGGAK